MFDANARGLPVGCKFFVEVHYCTEESPLYDFGIRKGDYLYCTKPELVLESKQQIIIHKDKAGLCIDNDEYDEESFLVFEGRLDGSDFICEKSKGVCMKIKEELNLK